MGSEFSDITSIPSTPLSLAVGRGVPVAQRAIIPLPQRLIIPNVAPYLGRRRNYTSLAVPYVLLIEGSTATATATWKEVEVQLSLFQSARRIFVTSDEPTPMVESANLVSGSTTTWSWASNLYVQFQNPLPLGHAQSLEQGVVVSSIPEGEATVVNVGTVSVYLGYEKGAYQLTGEVPTQTSASLTFDEFDA